MTSSLDFDAAHRVPIDHLSPSLPNAGGHSYILANVVLVWPYSSATRTLAWLLADPDVRAAKSKGQVKVVFRGACARHVAQTKTGIGDAVKLALVGCQWKDTGDAVSTPGKKIDWDLEFADRAVLRVLQDGQVKASTDYTSAGRSSPVADDSRPRWPTTPSWHHHPSSSPATSHMGRVNHVHLADAIAVPHFSPSKGPRAPLPDPFLNAALDAFRDGDGRDFGRARKRTKFARPSDAWSLAASDSDGESHDSPTRTRAKEGQVSPTPEKVVVRQESAPTPREVVANEEGPPGDTTRPSTLGAASATGHSPRNVVQSSNHPTRADDDSSIQPVPMGPPQTPRKLDQSRLARIFARGEFDPTSTPRLIPLPSPGLPLVSPLVERHTQPVEYLTAVGAAVSNVPAAGAQASIAIEEASMATQDTPTKSPQSDESDESEAIVILSERKIVQEHEPDHGASTAMTTGHGKPTDAAITLPGDGGGLSSPIAMPPFNLATPQLDLPEPEQWLASVEANIADQLAAESHLLDGLQFAQSQHVPEIEDEDLYGPPLTLPAAPSAETGQEARDVLDEFLHLSPVTATRPDPAFPLAVADIPATEAEITVDSGGQPPRWGRTDDAAAVNLERSHAMAHASSRPPSKEAEFKPRSPSSQDPSASMHPNISTLDGNTDNDNVPPRNLQGERRPAEPGNGASTGGSSERLATLKRDAIPGIGSESAVSALGTATLSDERSVQPALQMPSAEPDGQVHLPTPDQSQPEERDETKEQIADTSPVVAPPSPRGTQEESLASAMQSDVQGQGDGTDTRPSTETPRARRSSRRVSARKSVVPNISSPYFTPRRPKPAPLSLPTQEGSEIPEERVRSHASLSPVTHKPKKADQNDRARPASSPVAAPSAETPRALRKRGIVTPLAYFPRLSTIHEYFGQVVDVIAVCTAPSSSPERSKSGPKDYHSTLRLADQSLVDEGQDGVSVHIFRPFRNALPSSRRGDVVILRGFKVQTARARFELLSTDVSSWAVFQSAGDSAASPAKVVISGPPVEYGLAETGYVESLMSWWETAGAQEQPSRHPEAEHRPDTPRARSVPAADATPRVLRSHGKTAPSHRRAESLTDHFGNGGEIEQGVRPNDLDASTALSDWTNRRRQSTVSIAGSTLKESVEEATSRRSLRNRRSPSVVHELRDGTKYVDDARRSPSVVHELRDGATYIDE